MSVACGALLLLMPATARPPSTDTWDVHVAPLYLWASEMSGEVSVRNVTTPVYMSFGAGDVTQPTTLPASAAGQAGVDYQMTHRGPLVALNLRWGGQ